MEFRVYQNGPACPGEIMPVQLDLRSIGQTSAVWSAWSVAIGYDSSSMRLYDVTFPANPAMPDCRHTFYLTAPSCDGCPNKLLVMQTVCDPIGTVPDTDYSLQDLANIEFRVADDTSLIGTNLPLQFFWSSCSDNILQSGDGDTLFTASSVLDPDGVEIAEPHQGLPSFTGPHDSCASLLINEAPFVRPALATRSTNLYVESGVATDVDEELDQQSQGPIVTVYPNPVEENTSIFLNIVSSCRMRLELYNSSGRLVGRVRARVGPGALALRFNILTNVEKLASGVYFLRTVAGDRESVRKLVRIK